MTAAAIERPDLRLWVASAVVVLGLHVTAAALLLTWHVPVGFGEPTSAIVVDLAPFAAPPSDSVEDAAPGPAQQKTEEPPPVPPVSEPKAEENVEAPPAPVPPVVALPPPQPEIPKPAVIPKPPTPTHVRPAPAATTAPPRPHAATAGDAKAWYGAIMTRIQKSKSYPPAAQSRGEKGVVQLAFSIDREGRVVASRIARSSGFAALDQETIATVRRAQPFPPAPHDLSGAKFDFTVPVEFNIR